MLKLRVKMHHVKVDEESDEVSRVRQEQPFDVLVRALCFHKFLLKHLINAGEDVVHGRLLLILLVNIIE